MRTIHFFIIIVAVLMLLPGEAYCKQSADKASAKAEFEQLDQELKPLREKAALEKSVIAARARIDKAFRNFYKAQETAMVKLDPAAESKLARYNELKHQVKGSQGGSRAADYQAKAKKKSQAADKQESPSPQASK